MLMFGDKAGGVDAGADADLIKDGTEATFMADVIEGSADVPVIVDFWAPGAGHANNWGQHWKQR